MSNHFTYEIDERKLRVRLKDLERPVSEDAWPKFEVFYAANNKQSNSDIFKNIQIPLNRNVILPIVFGGIIILFSFLLFNFIDIKNPPKENVQKTDAPHVTAPAKHEPQQIQNNAIVSAQKIENPAKELKSEEPKVVAITPTIAAKPVPATSQPLVQSRTPATNQAITRPATQIRTQVASQTAVQPATQAVSPPAGIPTASVAVTKTDTTRKQKRRAVPEMVEAERSPDMRPSLTTDDREAEIRPN